MTSSGYRELKRVFLSACEVEPTERRALLDQICAGNDELRREVEMLLEADQRQPTFSPPWSSFVPGQVLEGRLSTYRIIRKLGQGGMGAVVLAHEDRLEREVALKFLRPRPHQTAERLVAALEREAKLLARVSHPNIAAIHCLDELNGLACLVLEYVDGVRLTDRLSGGEMTAVTGLRIGVQIASALKAAHSRGIAHRDLKPDNILIDDADRVSLLDFGIAKAFFDSSVQSDDQSTAFPLRESAVALLFGTPGYMSPEQVRGEAQDERSDIFSFGALLFECLSGSMAFPLSSVADSIADVLRGEPDWALLPRSLPDSLLALLKSCLRKEREERLADIGEAEEELSRVLRTIESLPASPAPTTREAGPGRLGHRKRSRRGARLSVVFLLLAGALWGLLRVFFPGTEAIGALGVTEFRLDHFETREKGVVHRGGIGVQSSGALQGDFVQIRIELSRAAYFYLLAGNPDGSLQLCHPRAASKPPSELRSLLFPDTTRGFRLNDGVGQQLFVLLASLEPLPSFESWRLDAGELGWRANQLGGVWRFDGAELRLERRVGAEERGDIARLDGGEVLDGVWKRMKGRREFQAVAGIAFPVVETSVLMEKGG